MILDPKWILEIEESEEFSADMNAASLRRKTGVSPPWISQLHQLWDLKGRELVEYWEGVRECWEKRKLGGADQIEDMIHTQDEELQSLAEEEAMFWNY